MSPHLWVGTVAVLLLCACSNPCDRFVEERCRCGPAACAAARDEVRLELGLWTRLGGDTSMKATLERRCQARLPQVRCEPRSGRGSPSRRNP